MNEENEKRVLAALYDRLYQAVTHTPSGMSAAFDRATTLVQFSKNEPLNPDDFDNAATPANPNGDLNTAESFSRMVDVVPAVQAEFAPGSSTLSSTYRGIVDGANSAVTTDPQQQEIYEQAHRFLNESTTIKDFRGDEITAYRNSAIYQAYLDNQVAYTAAVSAYRTAYLGYDLSKIDEQRKWQANEPPLGNAVRQAYSTWRAQGAAEVEEALAAIDTSINSAIRNVLEDARQAVAPQSGMAPSLAGGEPWYMACALPTNWYEESAVVNFSTLTLSSAYLDAEAHSNYTAYGGGASWSAGLWSVGGSVSGSSGSSNFHMDASSITLTARLGVVRILRPWLRGAIFRMGSWFMDSQGKHGISNGKLEGNAMSLLPLIPTAFVVARDIEIAADFSSEDRRHVESAISTSVRVGWGPFSVSARYSHSRSDDYFHSTFDGGALKVPGIQIVAWISEIVPASPPEDPK